MGFKRTPEQLEHYREAARRYRQSTFKDRVFKALEIRGADECWPWKGSKDTKGYGRIKSGGKVLKAHRVVYELMKGVKLPREVFLLHTCPGGDNPSCCNPSHLRTGDTTANMRDASERGQLSHGERHYAAVLTSEKVKEIRELYGAGRTQTGLARDYGVSQAHISRLVKHTSWRHL